jgi:hypothetical protein
VSAPHRTVECDCPVPYQMGPAQQRRWVAYLAQLAQRILAGEIRHVSLSIHPNPPTLGIQEKVE